MRADNLVLNQARGLQTREAVLDALQLAGSGHGRWVYAFSGVLGVSGDTPLLVIEKPPGAGGLVIDCRMEPTFYDRLGFYSITQSPFTKVQALEANNKAAQFIHTGTDRIEIGLGIKTGGSPAVSVDDAYGIVLTVDIF